MPGPDDPDKVVQNYQPSRAPRGRPGPTADGDGLSDDFETNVFFSDPNAVDPDGDGLSDWAEYWVDTKPKVADSDGDGLLDGEDLAFGDPLAVTPAGPSGPPCASRPARFRRRGLGQGQGLRCATTSRPRKAPSRTTLTATVMDR